MQVSMWNEYNLKTITHSHAYSSTRTNTRTHGPAIQVFNHIHPGSQHQHNCNSISHDTVPESHRLNYTGCVCTRNIVLWAFCCVSMCVCCYSRRIVMWNTFSFHVLTANATVVYVFDRHETGTTGNNNNPCVSRVWFHSCTRTHAHHIQNEMFKHF